MPRGGEGAAVADAMLEAVGRVYAAATAGAGGEAAWQAALGALLAATRFDGAALYALDTGTDPVASGTPLVIRGLWHGLNTEAQDEYARHYVTIDPRAAYMRRHPRTRILHDRLHTPEAEMDRDPFYAWYRRTQETRFYVGGRSAPGLPFFVGLTLHRRARPGPAEPEDCRRFAALFDHVERAVAIEHRLLGERPAGPHAAFVEDHRTGIVLVDRAGRVRHANRAARAMAAADDAFRLAPRLHAMRGEDDRALSSLLGTALGGEAAGPWHLPRSSGRRPYLLLATPLAPGAGLFADFAAAACVLVTDPERTARPPEEVLRRAFDLTAAEARLVARLADGETLEAAAGALRLARATARSHLAAAFRKTGTSRQAELVRLVLTLPALCRTGGPASPGEA